ncbi:Elongator complex protein 1 [Camellia lanceoleosa]|uniref:Elongator complex protein 1 n=1 Tax=Camellia lanceoleosa TaxID=1840588 RepID=A0ACC0IZZ3_9ERIC|nr:Elongator complex protein 1 [Camellia lanceoleosa]
MSLTTGAKCELKALLVSLVMLGKEDIARRLQRIGENCQLSQMAAVKLAEDAIVDSALTAATICFSWLHILRYVPDLYTVRIGG